MTIFLALIALMAPPLLAQTATVRGQVTDETGALVPQAKVVLRGPDGAVKAATADDRGAYSITGLSPGDYTGTASAPQLQTRQPVAIPLRQGVQTLNFRLAVMSTAEHVTVAESSGPGIDIDSASNAGALVLRG